MTGQICETVKQLYNFPRIGKNKVQTCMPKTQNLKQSVGLSSIGIYYKKNKQDKQNISAKVSEALVKHVK